MAWTGKARDRLHYDALASWPALLGFSVLAAALLLACLQPAQAGEDDARRASEGDWGAAERRQAFETLDPKYSRWIRNVAGLITEAEVDYFLQLREDFRRDKFMEQFWEPRNLRPGSHGNALRERWLELGGETQSLPASDPRFLALLLNGSPGGWALPNGQVVSRCFSRSYELEIWFYLRGERVDEPFPLIFFQRAPDKAWEALQPGDSAQPRRRSGGLPTTDLALLCADELLRYARAEVQKIADYRTLLERALRPPMPSREWLAGLSSSSTDLPKGAETFELIPKVDFPARRGSRTATRVILPISRESAPGREFEGRWHHLFELTGEVLRDGEVFEDFRYRFEGPTLDGVEVISLGFQRYLRPGSIEIRILAQDVYGNRYGRAALLLEVPKPEGLPESKSVNASEVAARPLVLLDPPGETQSGSVRFRARASRSFDKVTFFVDEKEVLSKRNPPYSVELELGEAVVPHRVRVVGFEAGQEVATDQLWLNQGTRRFRVRLIEPRPGAIYPGSVTARAELDLPELLRLDRIEIYLGDEMVASLTEPPFVHEVLVPAGEPSVVRALAHLEDGSTSEDTVLINLSGAPEQVTVRLAELFPLVVDPSSQPILGLRKEDFQLFVEGEPRPIEGFRAAGNTPIELAIMIDRSASMAGDLTQVSDSALAMVRATEGHAENRVAVFSFADRLKVESPFSANETLAEKALAGLIAGGQTAFFRSVTEALLEFGERGGNRALVLFSDGLEDIDQSSTDASRLGIETLVETIVSHRVTVYVIAPRRAVASREEQKTLERIAAVSGGQLVILDELAALPATYNRILDELQSRYMLTFSRLPSDATSGSQDLRIEVAASNATVHAPTSVHW